MWCKVLYIADLFCLHGNIRPRNITISLFFGALKFFFDFFVFLVKAAPWDDINFRFYFHTEVVYPTDHVFIFFRIFIFLQIFLINISMKPEVTQTNYLYT